MSVQEFNLASKYRPDIDGLRAVAVLPVVAYHAGFATISGGFVGVDIFFVISGYLISGILYREFAEHKFSFWGFYERRIRRIFPALFALLLFTLVMGYFFLLPTELSALAESMTAAAASVANLYFFNTVDYFDGAADTKPLLHTWSLAVEEQFYVFFPILLVFIHRYARRWLVPTLAVLAILSFVTASYLVFKSAAAVFYQPQFRAWELLAGGLLAIIKPAAPQQAWRRNLMAMGGLAAIGASFFLLDASMPFPGLTALPACLGTVLILWSTGDGRTNLVSQGLSTPPLRFVGLISYSLYLWHWPIIVFLEQAAPFAPVTLPSGTTGKFLAVGLSLAAAYLSWRFVEQPFRQSFKRVSARQVVGVGVLAVLLVALLCQVIIHQKGLPYRFPAAVQQTATYLDYREQDTFRTGDCFIDSKHSFKDFKPDLCLQNGSGKVSYMLMGDSHAAHYWWGLSQELAGSAVGQVTASGCRNTKVQSPRAPARCSDTLNYAYGDGLIRFNPDVIVLGGRWKAADLPELARTLDALKRGRARVILVGPIIQYDSPLPRLFIAAKLRNDSLWPDRHQLKGGQTLDLQMEALARAKGVTYLSPYRTLCRDGRCQHETPSGAPMQFDYGHMTAEGSIYLVRTWRKQQPDAFLPS